jgi:hypothetical protein
MLISSKQNISVDLKKAKRDRFLTPVVLFLWALLLQPLLCLFHGDMDSRNERDVLSTRRQGKGWHLD